MKNGLHCDNFIENFRLTIAPLLGQRINKKKKDIFWQVVITKRMIVKQYFVICNLLPLTTEITSQWHKQS